MSKLTLAKSTLLFLLLTLFGCKTYTHILDSEVSYLRAEEDINADADIEEFISSYRTQVSKEMDVVIGQLPVELKKNKPNSNLGNWFADILEAESVKIFKEPIAFAAQNYGGLRLPYLSAGPLTVGKIYELMPFDNTLVLLDMKKEDIQLFLDGIAEYGGWPISKQLEFTISDNKATDITINGKPLADDQTYKVALPDYIATGGDGNENLKNLPYLDSGVFIRDIVITHLQELQAAEKEILVDSGKRIK